MKQFFMKEEFKGRPHLEAAESPIYFCGVSSGLRYLRCLLFGSERLTEVNEGHEAELLALKNSVSHPGAVHFSIASQARFVSNGRRAATNMNLRHWTMIGITLATLSMPSPALQA